MLLVLAVLPVLLHRICSGRCLAESSILASLKKDEKSKKADARKTLGNEEGSKEAFDDEDKTTDDDEKGLEISRLETKGSSRYMMQRLSDGTECDLTGKPRKIDVQVCPGSSIVSYHNANISASSTATLSLPTESP